MTSSPKRIGIVSWDFLHPKGGMGRSLQWIADSLAKMAPVVVGAPASDGPRVLVEPLLPFTRGIGGHLLFSLLLLFRLPGFIRKHAITDLVVPVGPGGVLLLFKPKHVRLIACVYHTYLQQARRVPGEWWKTIFIPLERRMLRMADCVLCFSADTKRILIADHRIDAARIRLLPHAIDGSWGRTVDAAKEPGFCVCIARLDVRKGVDVLLKGWEDVHRSMPEARLLLIGHGAGQARADRMIARLGPSVRRLAEASFADLQQYVRSAQLALCPAYLEGFGLACAEAMTAGTVVIAGDADGLRCLVSQGKTGWLFPPGNSHALAQRIIHALSDDTLREKMGHAAKSAASRMFDADAAESDLRAAVLGRDGAGNPT